MAEYNQRLGRCTCLKQLEGKPIRFVFWIRKAEVFSFWVSDDERGKSRGYMGAGSTNCEGIRDI